MTETRKVDGGELCVRTLVKAGVTDAFVLHGGHLDPIFQACLDHDIRLIDTRHEAAAGHAADAYARQTGRCAVAMAKPVTKWAAQVTRTELIPHLVAHGFRETTNGQPGPVLLEIPIDLQLSAAEECCSPVQPGNCEYLRHGPVFPFMPTIKRVA